MTGSSTTAVADWAAAHLHDESSSAAVVVEIRERLDAAGTDAVAVLAEAPPTSDEPLRLAKSRLADLGRCERTARAPAGAPGELSPSMLRGVALDHFIAHRLWAGPVTAAAQDLASMALACGDHELHDHLEDLPPGDADDLLAPLAASVECWADIDPAWWPRTQTAASVVLADGAVVCSGRVDVELGGPLSGRPSLAIEVKSSSLRADHTAEAYLYALLVALRDGQAPAAVGLWYPGGPVVDLPVGPGTLWAAAERLSDGLRRWAELEAGRTPAESPGPWCRWCPEADVCPSALAPDDAAVDR